MDGQTGRILVLRGRYVCVFGWGKCSIKQMGLQVGIVIALLLNGVADDEQE